MHTYFEKQLPSNLQVTRWSIYRDKREERRGGQLQRISYSLVYKSVYRHAFFLSFMLKVDPIEQYS